MTMDINCPACGFAFDLLTAFTEEADRRALERFVNACLPIGDRVMRYLVLFTPPKHGLTSAKKLKLITQLLPDLERRAITHRGRDWAAPLTSWAHAIDQMLASRDANGLDLPMKSHGYLYSILASMADKFEAQAERQAEQERRTAPKQGTVQVRGQALSIGEGLQAVFGGKDPALAKLDDDTRNAARMPEDVREKLNNLRGGKA